MLLERPRHTNLDEIIDVRRASRGEQHCENDQKCFSEFEGNNWAKIACGNISSQVLRNGSDKWFVICPKLKCSTFSKMAEMFDGCMGS
jgi:hypothetical protein